MLYLLIDACAARLITAVTGRPGRDQHEVVAKMLDGKATARGKRTTAQAAEDSKSAAFLTEDGTATDRETLIGLLRSTLEVKGWSKTVMVELQGLEPWTSSMPWKRSSQLSYSPTRITLLTAY